MDQKTRKIIPLSFVLGAAFLGLGLSMPSCPGQQAMQQQIDTVQQGQTIAVKKIQFLESQIKTLTEDSTQVKADLADSRKMLGALNDVVNQLQTKVESLQKAPAKSSGKRKK